MSESDRLSFGELPEPARRALGFHLAELKATAKKSEEHSDIVALELQMLDLGDIGRAACSLRGLADAMQRSSALADAKGRHFAAMSRILEQFV
ncbi:hypothetical protein ASC77_18605 [Nocardioides sp. Root1257]|uniref:hypothetical protein n=1 Tax=unclassified Nocardioides TaxID=2615069 RepID=UPI00071459FB|nr:MULTISPECIES: hypothetical protein [unclassified Nocardioides]KQW45928.1 hypothetical protein ASC77_18605 [Nocardioides sp. Root1257]